MRKWTLSETHRHVGILALAGALLFVEVWFYGMAFRGTGDAFLNTLPLFNYALDALGRGALPLWNPYVASGYNFLGDPMSPVFDWTMWPLIPVVHAKTVFLNMLSLRLYLLLVGAGVAFYFALRRRVEPLPALFGASAYMLSPAAMWFLSGMAQVLGLFYGAVLFYLVMSADRRSQLTNFLLIALTVGLMFLSGQLAGCAFAWLVVFFALCALTPASVLATRIKIFVPATCAGIMLSSIRIWPMIVAGMASNRVAQDPSRFLPTAQPTYWLRSLVPDFLGWNTTSAFIEMPLEWANLSYVGTVGLVLVLFAAIADGHHFRTLLGFVFLALFGVLALTYTPVIYQFATSLLSPLVTGETLYFNFIFPTCAGVLIAHSAQRLMNGQWNSALVAQIQSQIIFILVMVLAGLAAFVSYFSPLASPQWTSVMLKVALLTGLILVTLKPAQIWLQRAARMFFLVVILNLLVTLAPVVEWMRLQNVLGHTLYFVSNSQLSLIVLGLALPIIWWGVRSSWIIVGAPVLIATLVLVWAASYALVPYNVHELPLAPGFELSSLLGMMRLMLLSLGSLALLCLALSKKTRALWYLLLALQMVELTGLGKNLISSMAMPFAPAAKIFPDAPDLKGGNNDRFAAEREGLQGMIDNRPVWYRLRVAGGYLNFAPREYVELAAAALDQPMANQFRVLTIPPNHVFAALTASNDFIAPNLTLTPLQSRERIERVSVVYRSEVQPDGPLRLKRLTSSNFDVKHSLVLEEGVPIHFPSEAQSVKIVKDHEAELEFEVSNARDGFLLLRESFDRGWSAEINGAPAPILRANHAFMAVKLAAGQNAVRFRFWPRGFTVGILVTLFTAISLGGVAIFGRRLGHR